MVRDDGSASSGDERHGNYVETSDDELEDLPINLNTAVGSLLYQASHGSLPLKRLQVPDQSADLDGFVRCIQHNLGAELNASIREKKARKKGALVCDPEKLLSSKQVKQEYHITHHGCGHYVALLKKNGMSKNEHHEETKKMLFHLVRIGSSNKDSDLAYVVGTNDRKKKKEGSPYLWVIYLTLSGDPTVERVAENGDPLTMNLYDIDYIKPLMDMEATHRRLKECQFMDLIRCPTNGECLDPLPEMDFEDIDQDLVPCNDEQFESIPNIGRWRIVVIQGPPGTGKSTTIANGIIYRLPRDRQSLVVSERRQAVGAVAEKLAKTMNDPVDPRAYSYETYDRTMTIVGNTAHLMQKLPKEMEGYCLDVQVKRIADARPEVMERRAELDHVIQLVKEVKRMKSLEKPIERLSTYADRMNNTWFIDKDFKLRKMRDGLVRYIVRLAPNYQGYVQFLEIQKPCTTMNEFLALFLQGWEQHFDWFYEKQKREIEAHILGTSTTVLCTISTLYTKRMRQMKGVHSIYVDEAATVSEDSMAIMALMEPTTLVLVGDHKQLRPFSNCRFKLCSKEDDVMRSFFERCVDVGMEYQTLRFNFRNPTAIIDRANITTYDGLLEQGQEVDPGPPNSIEWVNHNHKENVLSENEVSQYNLLEIDVLIKTYRRHIREFPNKTIAITTFYKGQFAKIKKAMGSIMRSQDVLVTVDSCQGSEYDIVIISCVRSNKKKRVGFCKHENRLNVATTRARFKLVFVGNMSTFRNASPEWAVWCEQ